MFKYKITLGKSNTTEDYTEMKYTINGRDEDEIDGNISKVLKHANKELNIGSRVPWEVIHKENDRLIVYNKVLDSMREQQAAIEAKLTSSINLKYQVIFGKNNMVEDYTERKYTVEGKDEIEVINCINKLYVRVNMEHNTGSAVPYELISKEAIAPSKINDSIYD